MKVRHAVAAAVLAGVLGAVPLVSQDTRGAIALDAALMAWDRGDYPAALEGLLAILGSSDGNALHDRIAELTGEVFVTHELTTDGSSPRFSPIGDLIAYDIGQRPARRATIVRAEPPFAPVATLEGTSLVFSPSGDRVAYLRLSGDVEIEASFARLGNATTDGGRCEAYRQLAWDTARRSSLVVRSLATSEEVVLRTDGFLKAAPAFSAEGHSLFFVGAREDDLSATDVYVASASAPPVKVTDGPGFKADLQVGSAGDVLLVTYVERSSFQKPPAPSTSPGQGPGQPCSIRPPAALQAFGVVNLATRRVERVDGAQPTLSADGRSLAYLRRQDAKQALSVSAPDAAARPAILETVDQIARPAFSPDGARLVYQRMLDDDWELFVIDRNGQNDRRLTREIQHDVLPRFLDNARVLAAIGEPRHRRSYLYDLESTRRTRLFHNNTVRTIVPEYVWVPDASGRRVLIEAERDGDTVSPDRGIYLTTLDVRVSREALRARLESSLAGERSLRAFGRKAYAPIADQVEQVLAGASVGKVFQHEKALYDLDSKHIKKPGNRLAAEYLFGAYGSLGYQPEYQWFEDSDALGGKAANVLATLRGTEDPDLVYVVSSHYDSVEAGPGADDDTSGTAALLESARLLARSPMPATIVFASFTGEEAGLRGSRAFVRQAQASKMRVVGALNNDMIGWANDHRLDNTVRYSNAGIRDLQHAAAFLFTRLITYDALYYKSTDAAAYYEAFGDIVGGIGSYPVLGNPHYHQPSDHLDTVNHELVTETAKVTTATVMRLASSPSRVRGLAVESYDTRSKSATLVWERSPESRVDRYVVAYGPPDQPFRHEITVRAPRVALRSVAAGTKVAVKAINARGLDGWDWARTTIEAPAGARPRR